MNDVFREFLVETHENLAQLDLDLVSLEKEPEERETLARVFRTVHTVKGTAGFLGLLKLQSVAHAAENLLALLRDGQLRFNPDLATVLLTAVDAIRQMLASIEASETDGEVDYSAVIQCLEALSTESKPTSHAGSGEVRGSAPVLDRAVLDRTGTLHGTLEGRAESASVASGLPSLSAETRGQAVADSNIRVDVALLDKLMTLVGELVLARNQVIQFSSSQENAGFLGTVQRLNSLTTELQTSVMKTRMQPISTIWSKFPRVVRDLAVACGKQARIEMDGQETELDKTIIESIRDPLTHLVRNAIDHGIEPPSERAARGKPPEGRLTLHAFHESGKVVLEMTDDGAGMDPQRIKLKAIQAKLITPAQADRLTERDLVNLVFAPGLSTAEHVTQFSGRGVGMDVVRTHIEKIGGTVTIDTRQGAGTTVKVTIPLTLAIIPALTITSAGDRYAIPQVSLLELVRLEGEQAARGIELVHGVAVYRLRGNLLPLVDLNRELHPGTASRLGSLRSTAVDENTEVNIVVLQADDRQFGLVVDAIHDTEEIVVKPLQKQIKDIHAFAGATIMGDGRVALILDVLGLAQRAGVVSAVRERSLSEKPGSSASGDDEQQTLLLFTTEDGSRMAMPLKLVARLEEFPRSAVEQVGPLDVVQYRGEILPLISVAGALRRQRRRSVRSVARKRERRAARVEPSKTIQVVVYACAGRRVGLVVHQIVDIAEQAVVTRPALRHPRELSTAIVQGRVTEFLDVEHVIETMDPDLIEMSQPQPAEA